MTNIEVDTIKIREYGQDVTRLSTEYIELIHDLFKRMYQVPTVTEEWVGTSATTYANHLIQEKDQYVDYGTSLKKCGNMLINYADQLDDIVRKTNGVS